jgi:hypothetical protein
MRGARETQEAHGSRQSRAAASGAEGVYLNPPGAIVHSNLVTGSESWRVFFLRGLIWGGVDSSLRLKQPSRCRKDLHDGRS